MVQLWQYLLFRPFVNALIFLYRISGNFGIAVVVLTLIIRSILIPLTLPSLKAAKKIQELAPELEKLKKKHGSDKQKLMQAQMALYKQHGANPAAGCLPQIVQLIILIALYQSFYQVLRASGDIIAKLNKLLIPALKLAEGTVINIHFLYLDLSKPDVFHLPGVPFPIPGVFLLLAAITQFLSSKMMQPVVAVERKEAKETKEKSDDVAVAMQSQMLYLFPLMTILIGFTFPSGLVVYWFVFSLFAMVQQYFVSGWGGLTPLFKKMKGKSEGR